VRLNTITPNPYPNITFILYFSIGAKITNYPSFCTVIPDGPCNQKVVMKNNHEKPCTGPVSAVGR
jgi:hypothetical protein